jgi:hypothetical protein
LLAHFNITHFAHVIVAGRGQRAGAKAHKSERNQSPTKSGQGSFVFFDGMKHKSIEPFSEMGKAAL